MTKCEIKITSRQHEENGTVFTAKISGIQGIYDAEITGFFQHWGDDINASTWDPKPWAKVNTQDFTIEDVYSLLGNSDTDLGVEILDEILVPVMEEDHGLWIEDCEKERQEAISEFNENTRFYARQAGF